MIYKKIFGMKNPLWATKCTTSQPLVLSGDLRIPIDFFARALHVLDKIHALEHLLDTPNDEIGLTLMDERLPKRVRSKSGSPSGAL